MILKMVTDQFPPTSGDDTSGGLNKAIFGADV